MHALEHFGMGLGRFCVQITNFKNFDLWDPGAPVLVGWTGVA